MKLFREYVEMEPVEEGQGIMSKTFTVPSAPLSKESQLVDVEDASSGWFLTWLVDDSYLPGYK